MKIAIIGATGFVGKAITHELSDRNQKITAISRNPTASDTANLTNVKADIFDREALTEILKGHDVVICAYNPGWTNPNIYMDFIVGTTCIQQAVKMSGVNRFIVIGGAGSLYLEDGSQLLDSPHFPKEYHAGASAAKDYLNIIKAETELDWAFFSPAIEMHQGITTGRTGHYRLGKDNPVFDANNKSVLSVEDLAIVIADEVEQPKHHRERFTAAY